MEKNVGKAFRVNFFLLHQMFHFFPSISDRVMALKYFKNVLERVENIKEQFSGLDGETRGDEWGEEKCD